MTKEKYQVLLMNKKLTLIQLAKELKNISRACEIMGYSRQHYYNIKERYYKEGEAGLKARSRRPYRIASRASYAQEQEVLNHVLQYPSYSYQRVCDTIRFERGLYISAGKVRGIFNRHNLNRFKDRLLYLEREYQKQGFTLTKEQILLLSRISEKIEYQHIEAPFTGYLMAQDTFYVGYLKGVGKVYLQTVIDCSNSFAFAKLYTNKDALVAAHALQDRILPYYRKYDVPIKAMLTDNGSEYCGTSDHPYEFLLWLYGVEHRRTKIKSPQTNGFVERFHLTLLKEFFQVRFRIKYYHTVEELQHDLDEYLIFYNFYRPHRGYRLNGSTPFTKFLLNMRPLALPPAA